MYNVNIDDTFIVTVALWDENSGENASGQIVLYDVRDSNDAELSPPMNGVMQESSAVDGIYKTSVSLSYAGKYVFYATCSGFYSSSDEIIVNEENIYDLAKQNRNYNISVQDVLRTNSTPTASQLARNVPLNATDYIITVIKNDSDSDWSTATVSGITYAHYRSSSDELPYYMGSS